MRANSYWCSLANTIASHVKRRRRGPSLLDIPQDCGSLVLTFLCATEALPLLRVSHAASSLVRYSLKLPRHAKHRRSYGAVCEWLQKLRDGGVKIGSLDLGEQPTSWIASKELLSAARRGHPKAVDVLLAVGEADVEWQHPAKRENAITLAAAGGHAGALEVLLRHAEDDPAVAVAAGGRLLRYRGPEYGRLVQEGVLVAAVQSEDAATVDVLLEHCRELLHDGGDALRLAVSRGLSQTVETLLRHAQIIVRTAAASCSSLAGGILEYRNVEYNDIVSIQDKRRRPFLYRNHSTADILAIRNRVVPCPKSEPEPGRLIHEGLLRVAVQRGEVEPLDVLLRYCPELMLSASGSAAAALCFATAEAKVAVVRRLLDEAAAPVNARDADGNAAVHHAVRSANMYNGKHSERAHMVVDMLMQDARTDVNLRDRAGRTPLLVALNTHRHHDLALAILRDPRVDAHARDSRGRSALHYAASSGFVAAVEVLLEDTTLDVNARSTNCGPVALYADARSTNYGTDPFGARPINDGCTPLHEACTSRHTRIVEILLKDKRTNPNLLARGICSALILSPDPRSRDGADIVKLLLANERLRRSEGNLEELGAACAWGGATCLEVLLEDPHTSAHAIDASLRKAIRHPRCLALLLQDPRVGATAVRATLKPAFEIFDADATRVLLTNEVVHITEVHKLVSTEHESVLHEICCAVPAAATFLFEGTENSFAADMKSSHDSAEDRRVRMLYTVLRYTPVDRNRPSKMTRDSPIQYAVRRCSPRIADILLRDRQTDVRVRVPSNGDTLLHIAARNGDRPMLETLLRHPKVDAKWVNDQRETVLHVAVSMDEAQDATTRLEFMEFVLEIGEVDVNAQDANGCTALHRAVSHVARVARVARLLREDDIDVNARNGKGVTALLSASSPLPGTALSVAEVVRRLAADSRTDVNATDAEGRSRLHVAARRGEAEVVGVLLSNADTDVDLRERKFGRTPLEVAALEGHLDVVELLVADGRAALDSRMRRAVREEGRPRARAVKLASYLRLCAGLPRQRGEKRE